MADRDPFADLGFRPIGAQAPEEEPDPFDALGFRPAEKPGARAAPVGGVRVVGRDGTEATLSPEMADLAIAQGARLFEEVAAERREQALQAEYGGLGGQALAGAQGAARGLSLGLSDAASAALTGALTPEGPQLTPEARARIEALNRTRAPDQQLELPAQQSAFQTGYGAAREYQRNLQEANPITAGASEVGGALLGGAGGLLAKGGALAATPAGLAARAALGAQEAVGARLGGSALGRMGAMAAGGAVEGAIAGAAQQVADAVPEFSTDPIEAAEHILSGVGRGAILGAALGGGLQGVGEGARALSSSAIARSTGKLMSGVVPDLSPQGMREMAYESATKAAIGRTNIAAVRDANDLAGGVRGVGKTLLDDGIVARGDSAEEILEKASAATQKYGQQIDGLVSQLDESGALPDTRVIAQKIREAIEPIIASPSSRARGRALEAQFSDLVSEAEQGIGPFASFRSAWQERTRLDDEIVAAFRANSPVADGVQKVRRAFEDGFSELAEQQAGPAWTAAYREAKARYGHVKFAKEQSFKALESRLSNRWLSPSDYGMAAVGAVADNPMTGILGGLTNKLIRERGRSTVAAGMNWLAGFAEEAQRKSALVALASQGTDSIGRSASQLVTNVSRGRYAVGEAIASKFTDDDYAQAVAEAQQLGDPKSPLSQHLAQTAQQLDQVNPGMGTAYANAARARGQLIAGKLPPPAHKAIFGPAPALDPMTQRSVQRTVQAAHEPQKALERLAAGSDHPEDAEAVRVVYPAMFRRFQNRVVEELQKLKKPPPFETRLRIAYATGLAVDPTMQPGELGFLQGIAKQPDQQQQAEQQDAQRDHSVAQSFKPIDANSVYAPPVDARIDRR